MRVTAAVTLQSPNVFGTSGGTTVSITGTNFGAQTFDSSSPLVVTYGTYTASCTRVDSSRIRCVTAPGVGTGLRWQVTSADTTSAISTFTTRYAVTVAVWVLPLCKALGGDDLYRAGRSHAGIPGYPQHFRSSKSPATMSVLPRSVTRVTRVSVRPWVFVGSYQAPAVSTISASGSLPQAGGLSITLTGSNFGPGGTPVTARYGRYSAGPCTVTVPHTQVRYW